MNVPTPYPARGPVEEVFSFVDAVLWKFLFGDFAGDSNINALGFMTESYWQLLSDLYEIYSSSVLLISLYSFSV